MMGTCWDGTHLAAATKKLKSYFRGRGASSEKGLRATIRARISGINRRWRMSDQVNKFLGDSLGRTLIKLLVVSLIVGFIMAVFGWAPLDFVYGLRNFVLEVWHRGFAALGRVGDYLLLGATVVIPIFLLIRLFNYRR
jgi:pilus assembly protein TadC